MKWITHQTGAVLGGLVLGLSPLGVIAAGTGAIIPDVIDQSVSSLGGRRRQKVFNRIHRGQSHWFGWWLLLFLAPMLLELPRLLAESMAGLALGGLSHAGLDMLTPRGVPFLPWRGSLRLALPICSTGRIGEYVFLAVMLAASAFWFRDSIRPVLLSVADWL